jgi:hypothetical protein
LGGVPQFDANSHTVTQTKCHLVARRQACDPIRRNAVMSEFGGGGGKFGGGGGKFLGGGGGKFVGGGGGKS